MAIMFFALSNQSAKCARPVPTTSGGQVHTASAVGRGWMTGECAKPEGLRDLGVPLGR